MIDVGIGIFVPRVTPYRHCPRRSRCLPNTQKHRARFVYRSPHQDEINRVRKRQTTHQFKRRQAERRWKIEGLFAEGKQYHNLRRTRYRGLSKVQIQFFLVAIALNCNRAVNALHLLFNMLARVFGQRFEKNLIPTHSIHRQTLATN